MRVMGCVGGRTVGNRRVFCPVCDRRRVRTSTSGGSANLFFFQKGTKKGAAVVGTKKNFMCMTKVRSDFPRTLRLSGGNCGTFTLVCHPKTRATYRSLTETVTFLRRGTRGLRVSVASCSL